MPIGDSITEGGGTVWSYRRDFEGALLAAGCSYDLIGSRFGPTSGPAPSLIDRDHEGYWGRRAGEVLSELQEAVPGSAPDWALIHLGTNDVLQGASLASAQASIGLIIDLLRTENPSIGILLAQIIPNHPSSEADVVALNGLIASLATAKHQSGVSPVILVDQYSGYSTFVHNYDEIHPNLIGESIMADRWFQALLPEIQGVCTPP